MARRRRDLLAAYAAVARTDESNGDDDAPSVVEEHSTTPRVVPSSTPSISSRTREGVARAPRLDRPRLVPTWTPASGRRIRASPHSWLRFGSRRFARSTSFTAKTLENARVDAGVTSGTRTRSSRSAGPRFGLCRDRTWEAVVARAPGAGTARRRRGRGAVGEPCMQAAMTPRSTSCEPRRRLGRPADEEVHSGSRGTRRFRSRFQSTVPATGRPRGDAAGDSRPRARVFMHRRPRRAAFRRGGGGDRRQRRRRFESQRRRRFESGDDSTNRTRRFFGLPRVPRVPRERVRRVRRARGFESIQILRRRERRRDVARARRRRHRPVAMVRPRALARRRGALRASRRARGRRDAASLLTSLAASLPSTPPGGVATIARESKPPRTIIPTLQPTTTARSQSRRRAQPRRRFDARARSPPRPRPNPWFGRCSRRARRWTWDLTPRTCGPSEPSASSRNTSDPGSRGTRPRCGDWRSRW